MRLQSLNALGQAGLLIGADRIMKVNAPICGKQIQLDDWSRAVEELPSVAIATLDEIGETVASAFLAEPATPYQPIIPI